MNREELTAIVSAIIFQKNAELRALGKIKNEEGLLTESVDIAEHIIAESAKPPEQRKEERTARAVAQKMSAAEEAERMKAEAVKAQAAIQQLKSAMASQNAGQVQRQAVSPLRAAAMGLPEAGLSKPFSDAIKDFLK